MLVEPLADVDVNVPGVMAMLVAPAADQLRVLLAPEFMVAGFAAKDAICGTEPFPVGKLAEVPEAQPTRPAQQSRVRTSAQSSSPEEWSPRELSLFLQNGLRESMRNLFASLPLTTPV
jgi:hypothetical protein